MLYHHLNGAARRHFTIRKSDENKKLALFIQSSLRKNLNNTNRLAKAIQHVYLLRKTEAPAALVEVGFLSNHAERQKLMNNDYQNKVAESISFGVMRYFNGGKVPKD